MDNISVIPSYRSILPLAERSNLLTPSMGCVQKSEVRLIVDYVVHNYLDKVVESLFGTPEKKYTIISRRGEEYPLPHIRPAKPGLVDRVLKAASNVENAVRSFFEEDSLSPPKRPTSCFGILFADAGFLTNTPQIPKKRTHSPSPHNPHSISASISDPHSPQESDSHSENHSSPVSSTWTGLSFNESLSRIRTFSKFLLSKSSISLFGPKSTTNSKEHDSKTISRRNRKTTKTLSSNSNTSTGAIVVSTLALEKVTQATLSPSGSYLLTVQNNKLSLVAIAEDDTMSIQSTYDLPDTPLAACFSNDETQIFVADTQKNIYAIDLATMRVTNTFTIPGLTTLEMGPNGKLFVGTQNALLEVDVSGNILSTLSTPFPVAAIKCFRQYIVMSYENQVSIVDLNGQQLQVKKTFPLDSTSIIQELFALEDSGAVIAQVDKKLIIFNATKVANAFIQGSLSTDTETKLAFSEEYMISKDDTSGVFIHRGSKGWTTDQSVGFIPTQGKVEALAFSPDGTGIIVDGEGIKKFRVISDLGRLTVPLFRKTHTITTDTSIDKVLFNQRKNLIILGGEDAVQLMSSEDLNNPEILSSIPIEGRVVDVTWYPDQTTLIIVDSNQNVTIIDVKNPKQPKVLGRFKAAHPVKSMKLDVDKLALCEGNYGIEWVDVTNPSQMQQQEIWTNGRPFQIIPNVTIGNDTVHIIAEDSNGMNIYNSQKKLLYHVDTVEGASHVVLSHDKKTLYLSDGRTLRQFSISSPLSITEQASLSFDDKIEDIIINNSGEVAYVAVRDNGVFAVNTQSMVVGSSLPTDNPKSIALRSDENQIFVSNGYPGNLVLSDLISRLSLVALTPKTEFGVGTTVKQQVQFFDTDSSSRRKLPITSVKFILNGVEQKIPYWISEQDLMMGNININKPPADLTGQSFVIVFSVNIQGATQEVPYAGSVISSLLTELVEGKLVVDTVSEQITLTVTLQGNATFIPSTKINTGANVVFLKNDKVAFVSGSKASVNAWFNLQRVTSDDGTALVDVNDWFNTYPSTNSFQADIFAPGQSPVAVAPHFTTQIKLLDEIVASCRAFFKDDYSNLKFEMLTPVPKGLTFNPDTCELNGIIDKSMKGQQINLSTRAANGHGSITVEWRLDVDQSQPPKAKKNVSEIVILTGESKKLVINIFEDPMNHTIAASLFSSDGNELPAFCIWNPETKELTLSPQIGNIFINPKGDAGTYSFRATGINELDENTSLTFPVKVLISKADLTSLIYSYAGIAGTLIGVTTALFKWRALTNLFYHVFRRKSYWREEMPEELCAGKTYYPTHPQTSKSISEQEIQSIQAFCLNEEGCNLCGIISEYFKYVNEKKPLITGENFPSYIRITDNGGIYIDFGELEKSRQEAAEHGSSSHEVIFLQVIGNNNRILELIKIDPERLSRNVGLNFGLDIPDESKEDQPLIPMEKLPQVPLREPVQDDDKDDTTTEVKLEIEEEVESIANADQSQKPEPDQELLNAYGEQTDLL